MWILLAACFKFEAVVGEASSQGKVSTTKGMISVGVLTPAVMVYISGVSCTQHLGLDFYLV